MAYTSILRMNRSSLPWALYNLSESLLGQQMKLAKPLKIYPHLPRTEISVLYMRPQMCVMLISQRNLGKMSQNQYIEIRQRQHRDLFTTEPIRTHSPNFGAFFQQSKKLNSNPKPQSLLYQRNLLKILVNTILTTTPVSRDQSIAV